MAEVSGRRSCNLPADITRLVGRQGEVAEAKRLLSTSRLVVLTGVGGVGKTRLALRVAAELQRAFDGVWLVELADLEEPALVAETVATAIGLRDQSSRRPLAALSDFLATRRVLLVLDNCEHLVDACAVLSDALLRTAPDLRILGTSRQSLGITGECTLPVLPLPVPDPEQSPSVAALEGYDSVGLFVERAAAVVPGFCLTEDNAATVARVCHQLEGIPLAIELAAGRLRALSVGDLTACLVDRYGLLTGGSRTALPRQRTLRALIDWSFQLLSPTEQTLWERLAVFSGRFDLDAAEAVCAGGAIRRKDVLDLLDGLVDKSLLLREEHPTGLRFRMLETLRQHGRERLTEPRELARLHRDFYLGLAERAAMEWFGPDQVEWCARLRCERHNLRAALEFCLSEPGEIEAGLRLATALHQPYWLANSSFCEGRGWLDRLLRASGEPSATRARALHSGAWLALMQGDNETAREMLAECERLARRFEDPASLAYSSHLSGLAALHAGDREESIRLGQAGREAFARLGDRFGLAMSDFNMVPALSESGAAEQAVRLCRQALDLTDRHGEAWCRAYGLTVLAVEMWHQGDIPKATALAAEGLRANQTFGDRLGISVNLEVQAWIAAARERPEHAAVLLGAADAIARTARVCVLRLGRHIECHNRCAARLRERLGDERCVRLFERGARFTIAEAIAESLGDEAVEADPPPGERPTFRVAAPVAAPPVAAFPLTPREREVAELIAKGLSNKQIAAALVIAQRTAEGHVERILAKLGFSSRTQVAAWVTATNGAPRDIETQH